MRCLHVIVMRSRRRSELTCMLVVADRSYIRRLVNHCHLRPLAPMLEDRILLLLFFTKYYLSIDLGFSEKKYRYGLFFWGLSPALHQSTVQKFAAAESHFLTAYVSKHGPSIHIKMIYEHSIMRYVFTRFFITEVYPRDNCNRDSSPCAK